MARGKRGKGKAKSRPANNKRKDVVVSATKTATVELDRPCDHCQRKAECIAKLHAAFAKTEASVRATKPMGMKILDSGNIDEVIEAVVAKRAERKSYIYPSSKTPGSVSITCRRSSITCSSSANAIKSASSSSGTASPSSITVGAHGQKGRMRSRRLRDDDCVSCNAAEKKNVIDINKLHKYDDRYGSDWTLASNSSASSSEPEFISTSASPCESDSGDESESTKSTFKRVEDWTQINGQLDHLQNVSDQPILVNGRKNFKKLQKIHECVRIQQLNVLRRTNELYKMYIRNMEAIFRLGFSPVVVEERATSISDGITGVHDALDTWQDLMEDVFIESDGKKIILQTIFRNISNKVGKNFYEFSEFEYELFAKMIQELISKNEELEKLFTDIDAEDLSRQWLISKREIDDRLDQLDKDFCDLCIEYGVTNPLPKLKPKTDPVK